MKKWTDLKSPYDWERDSKLAGWILVISTVEVIIGLVIALIKNNPLVETIGATWILLFFPIRYWVINRMLGTTIYKWKEHKEKMKKRVAKKRLNEEMAAKMSQFPEWALHSQEKCYVLKLGKSLLCDVSFGGCVTIGGVELPQNVTDVCRKTTLYGNEHFNPSISTDIRQAQFMTRWEATLAQEKFGGEIKRIELCDPLDTNDTQRWRPHYID